MYEEICSVAGFVVFFFGYHVVRIVRINMYLVIYNHLPGDLIPESYSAHFLHLRDWYRIQPNCSQVFYY